MVVSTVNRMDAVAERVARTGTASNGNAGCPCAVCDRLFIVRIANGACSAYESRTASEREKAMTRGMYYSVVMPIAGILYVIVGIIAHSGIVWTVGALCVGIVAVAGNAIGRP